MSSAGMERVKDVQSTSIPPSQDQTPEEAKIEELEHEQVNIQNELLAPQKK